MANQPPMPALTVRASQATPLELPLNFVLGTSMAAVRQAPIAPEHAREICRPRMVKLIMRVCLVGQ
jgi:hypothetical protein